MSPERALVPVEPQLSLWQRLRGKLHEIIPFKSRELDLNLAKETIWKLLLDIKEGGIGERTSEDPPQYGGFKVILQNEGRLYKVETAIQPPFWLGLPGHVNFSAEDYENE